jgi:malonyl-CoA O-methyltransferase
MVLSRKQKIEKSFGSHVGSYDRNAVLQKKVAKRLCSFLPEVNPAKILEIGCGTGFLTAQLQRKYPQADILCTDISKEMVLASQQKFTGYRNLSFQVMDGENFLLDQKFDLIVSNLAVQWFDNPITGLQNISHNLTQDGLLYFSTIGNKSFSQWKQTLHDLDLPSGTLETPAYKGIFEETDKIISYKNALEFLRSLKIIGAQNPRIDYDPISSAELMRACKAFDSVHNGQITWHILYGCLNASGGARFGRN